MLVDATSPPDLKVTLRLRFDFVNSSKSHKCSFEQYYIRIFLKYLIVSITSLNHFELFNLLSSKTDDLLINIAISYSENARIINQTGNYSIVK